MDKRISNFLKIFLVLTVFLGVLMDVSFGESVSTLSKAWEKCNNNDGVCPNGLSLNSKTVTKNKDGSLTIGDTKNIVLDGSDGFKIPTIINGLKYYKAVTTKDLNPTTITATTSQTSQGSVNLETYNNIKKVLKMNGITINKNDPNQVFVQNVLDRKINRNYFDNKKSISQFAFLINNEITNFSSNFKTFKTKILTTELTAEERSILINLNDISGFLDVHGGKKHWAKVLYNKNLAAIEEAGTDPTNKQNAIEQARSDCKIDTKTCLEQITVGSPFFRDIASVFSKKDLVACVGSETCINKIALVDAFNKKNCNGNEWNACLFVDQVNIKEVYLDSLNQRIATISSKSITHQNGLKEVNKEILNAVFEVLPYNLNYNRLDELKSNIAENCFNLNLLSCNKAIEKICTVYQNLSSDCVSTLKAGIIRADSAQRVEVTKTSAFLMGLLSPDSNTIKALKLFGLEPDYRNVPSFLKDSFSSRICSSKINGYLDKNIVKGGGVTSYGCDYLQNGTISLKNGTIVSGVDPNCAGVLLDLRAKRTKVTPDLKIALTYSFFLKSRQDRNLNYFMAIKYRLADGTLKKVLIKPTNPIFSVPRNSPPVKVFESLSIPLNVTNLGQVVDTSNSFSIAVLVRFADTGAVYKQFSIPIPLVVFSDQNGVGKVFGTSGVGAGAITRGDLLSLI